MVIFLVTLFSQKDELQTLFTQKDQLEVKISVVRFLGFRGHLRFQLPQNPRDQFQLWIFLIIGTWFQFQLFQGRFGFSSGQFSDFKMGVGSGSS